MSKKNKKPKILNETKCIFQVRSERYNEAGFIEHVLEAKKAYIRSDLNCPIDSVVLTSFQAHKIHVGSLVMLHVRMEDYD